MRWIGVAVALVLICTIGCAEPSTADPTRCKPGWTFVESHGWWERFENGPNSRQVPMADGTMAHLHVGACLPLDQPITGNIETTIRVLQHKIAGGIETTSVDIGIGPGGDSIRKIPVDATCGPEPEACEFLVEARGDNAIPTSELETGRHELRIRPLPSHHDNGVRVFATTGWQVCVRACEPARADRQNPGHQEARAWSEESGYTRARYHESLAAGPPVVAPGWAPRLETSNADRSLVHVDAAFGNDDFGLVVANQAGEIDGPVAIPLDDLAPGTHCLAIRGDRTTARGTNVAVMQLPFVVEGGSGRRQGRGGCAPTTAGVR